MHSTNLTNKCSQSLHISDMRIFRDVRVLLQALVGAIVIFNAVTALNPGGTTFSEANQKDIQKRPAGMTQQIRH